MNFLVTVSTTLLFKMPVNSPPLLLPKRWSLVVGQDKVLRPRRDLRGRDDVALLDVAEEIRPLDDVPEAGIASVQHVLPRGGQIRVEQEPEELAAPRVGVVLLPRPSHRAVARERQHRRLAPPSLVLDAALVERALVSLGEYLERYQPLAVLPGADALGGRRDVAVRLALGIAGLDDETVGSLYVHVVVESPFDELDEVATGHGGFFYFCFRCVL